MQSTVEFLDQLLVYLRVALRASARVWTTKTALYDYKIMDYDGFALIKIAFKCICGLCVEPTDIRQKASHP